MSERCLKNVRCLSSRLRRVHAVRGLNWLNAVASTREAFFLSFVVVVVVRMSALQF